MRPHRSVRYKQRRRLCAHLPEASRSLTHESYFWQTYLISFTGNEDFLSVLSSILSSVHTFIGECHCGSEKPFSYETTRGLRGHLVAEKGSAHLGDVRSLRYPRTYPAQRAPTAAWPGSAVQSGTPPGQRPRRRGQPPETRTEGTQTGSDWSIQERCVSFLGVLWNRNIN